MKLDKTMIVKLAVASLFVGFVIISAAVGSIFPSIDKLTAPLICKGEVQVETGTYSYKPGQVGTDIHVYCIDDQGTQKEITFPAIGINGLISSAILFVILLFWARKSLFLPENFGELATSNRLSELKKMYAEKLISKGEYEMKRDAILKEH